LLLCGVVAAIWALRGTGLRVEDLQTALFPLVVLCVWRLPKSRRSGLPAPVLAALLCVWAVSALSVRGFLPDVMLREGVYLSRLDGDPSGLITRGLLWSYNRHAEEISGARMNMVERRLPSDADAAEWLKSRKRALAALRGSAGWMRLVFPPGSEIFRTDGSDRARELPLGIREVAESYGIADDENIRFVRHENVPVPLALVLFPEAVTLPAEPVELAREYLASLSEGLIRIRGVEPPDVRDLQRASFLNAAAVDGRWKTNAPRALARLAAANVDLLAALEEPEPEQGLLGCARYNFFSAVGSVQLRYAPEVASAIFNNIAVAIMVDAYSRKDLRDVRDFLLTAARADAGGQPMRGAKAAIVNLILLDRSGLL
jgi:hypothetical protein